jgi:hypothetical protein
LFELDDETKAAEKARKAHRSSILCELIVHEHRRRVVIARQMGATHLDEALRAMN